MYSMIRRIHSMPPDGNKTQNRNMKQIDAGKVHKSISSVQWRLYFCKKLDKCVCVCVCVFHRNRERERDPRLQSYSLGLNQEAYGMKACWSPHTEQLTGAPLIPGFEALSATWSRKESDHSPKSSFRFKVFHYFNQASLQRVSLSLFPGALPCIGEADKWSGKCVHL